MRRFLILLLIVMLCVGVVLTVLPLGSRGSDGRVYSITQIRAGLARNAHAWVGKTVWVRGTVLAMDPGLMQNGRLGGYPSYGLGDMPPNGVLFWVRQEPENEIWLALRRTPVLAHAVPPAQKLYWGIPRSYRVRLLAKSSCIPLRCPDALLLDAVSGQPSLP